MKDSTTSQEDEESEDEGLEEVQNTIIMTSLNQQFCVSVVFSKTSKQHVGPTWAAALLFKNQTNNSAEQPAEIMKYMVTCTGSRLLFGNPDKVTVRPGFYVIAVYSVPQRTEHDWNTKLLTCLLTSYSAIILFVMIQIAIICHCIERRLKKERESSSVFQIGIH